MKINSKLLLKPEDFRPSVKNWIVKGILNPGAMRLPDNKIMLYVRVAESAGIEHEQLKKCPMITSSRKSKFKYIDVDGKNPLKIKENKIVLVKDVCDVKLSHISHFRRVILGRNGFNIEKIEQKPIFSGTPISSNLGVEDPRIVKMENRYFMTYVGVSLKNGISSYMATSKDLKNWEKKWMIFSEQDKDVVLFPEKINDKYIVMHRPETSFSNYKPGIWLSYSPDLIHWGEDKILMRPRKNSWEQERIGAGPPPIKTDKGWLCIYHGVKIKKKINEINGKEEEYSIYSAGAVLLDLKKPEKILAISPKDKPLFEPSHEFEKVGFMNNVIFPTGIVETLDKKSVLLYCGGADTVTVVKKISFKDIFESMEWR